MASPGPGRASGSRVPAQWGRARSLASLLLPEFERARRPVYFAEALRLALERQELIQGCRLAHVDPQELADAATSDMEELCGPITAEEQRLAGLVSQAELLLPADGPSRAAFVLTRLLRLVAWLAVRHWPLPVLLGLATLYLSQFLEVVDWLRGPGSLAASSSIALSVLLPLAMAANVLWAGVVRVADVSAAPFGRRLLLRLVATPQEARTAAEISTTVDVLRERLVTAGLLPYLRGQLNARLRSTRATTLQMDGRPVPGLHQATDAELEIPTDALRAVDRAMRRMRSGSIGIAGPRGAGKTTLLRAICEGRLDTGEAVAPRRVAVAVSAPVGYDARDFLLHLYAELCRAVRSSLDPSAGAPEPLPLPELPEHAASELVREVLGVVARPGLVFATVLGTQLLLGDAVGRPPVASWLARVPGSASLLAAVPGGAALITAAAALGWLLRDLRGAARWAVARTITGLAVVVGLGAWALFALWHVGPALDRRLAGLALLAAAGAMVAVWIVYREAAWWWRDWRARDLLPADSSAWLPLDALAERRLRRIRFQQTYTSGWSGGMRVATLGGALGLDSGLIRSSTVAEVQQTLPQLVAELREFIANVTARGLTVIVAIDELDKIEQDAAARQFLNDLKPVFGVPGAFFLVSISENAMADFERRGMPFRDAFDSALDEVVSVGYLTFDESREVLRRRVIGIPIPFIGLAHVLSGGLARDLVRVTRHLVDLDLGGLSRTAHGLVRADLAGKVSTLLLALAVKEGYEEVVRWCAGLRSEPVRAADLLEHCADVGALGESDSGRPPRQASELAAYEYLCATVLEYFVDDRPEQDWRRIEEEGHLLDGLAAARQAFAVSPWLAWSRVSSFRRQWDLTVLPGPG